jgi:hypothetical protein
MHLVNAENRLVYYMDHPPMDIAFLASAMVPPLTPRTLITRLDKFATRLSDGWYCDLAQFERIVRNRFGPRVLPGYRR